VRHAKSLLRAGLPIALVAAEAGFYDQAHLTRHFKRIVGLTPGRYATEARRME
jgi:transcriptional regulator GlxA family with amidase domain